MKLTKIQHEIIRRSQELNDFCRGDIWNFGYTDYLRNGGSKDPTDFYIEKFPDRVKDILGVKRKPDYWKDLPKPMRKMKGWAIQRADVSREMRSNQIVEILDVTLIRSWKSRKERVKK